MEWYELALKVLQILSWPLAAIFIAIFLGLIFKRSLSRLIDRMVRARGPGGTEVTFDEQQRSLDDVKSPLGEGQVEQIRSGLETVVKEKEEAVSKVRGQSDRIQVLEQELFSLQDLINRYAADYAKLAQYAEGLELDYLRHQYTIPTKQLLSWIAQQGETTHVAVAARAARLGIMPENFETTSNALARFRMITSDGERIRITDKGKRAVAYMRQHANMWERIVGL